MINLRRALLIVPAVLLLVLTLGPSVGVNAQQAAPPAERLALGVNRSLVLPTPFDVTRIAITNPAIADATVVEPREILIDGKASGTVTLIVWGATQRLQYDVVVDPGVSPLQQTLQALFPGEDIQANQSADVVILTGHVSSNGVMLRAGEVSEATVPKAKIINMLQLPGGSESQQVLLQVRVAEVNRRLTTEAGISLFTGGSGYKDFVARSTTGQFSAPAFDSTNGSSNGLTLNDFLNLFVFNTKYNIGLVIRALEQTGYFQTLAEPNLIAYNGQEASFLAGGELPVPVVQGTTGSVSVQFKEFGIRLTFRPTIAGDVIRLKVKPEVSTLDFSNGISLGGYRIPALQTRRAETDVELRDGQSFAIAGLMNNLSQLNKSQIPLLGNLPIIGNLFKSRANDRQQTELMVLVTPRLVRPLNPDEVPTLPTASDQFLPVEPNGGAPGPGTTTIPPPPPGAPAQPAPPR